MKHLSTRSLTGCAVTAALYLVLTLAQNALLPTTASSGVQFRIAEALCVLTLFVPDMTLGLAIGCLIFNLTNAAALPLDFLVGTVATLLSGIAMYALRKVQVFRIPLLSLLMPALCNGMLVGWELTVYVGSPLWLNVLCIAAGEAAVLLTLGLALYAALRRHSQRLFGR